MTILDLSSGTAVTVDGIKGVTDCRSIDPPGWWVTPDRGGPTKPFILSDIEIPIRLLAGTLDLGPLDESRTLPSGARADEDNATPEDRATMAFRLTFVEAILAADRRGRKAFRNVRDWAEAVTAHLEVPDGRTRPSGSTVMRWHGKYRRTGKRRSTMLPRDAWKGDRRDRKPDFVRDAVEDAIDAEYGGKGTIPAVADLAEEIAKASLPTDLSRYVVTKRRKDGTVAVDSLIPRLPDGSIDWKALVSHSYVRRRVERRTARDRAEMIHGPTEAERMMAVVGTAPAGRVPLALTEIDNFRLKIFVVDDEKRLPLGFPWITVLLDTASRAVLGLSIGFMPPSGDTVAQCLAHAVMPKDLSWVGNDPETGEPIITRQWPMFGPPIRVRCDQGGDFISGHMRDACYRMGMHLDVLPPAAPQLKGKVERFIGTVKRSKVGRILGLLPHQRAKGKSEAGAEHLVTLDELRLLLTYWIVEVYHQRRHGGIGKTPEQAWIDLNRNSYVRRPPSRALLADVVGCHEVRIIDDQGIRLHGLKYNSPELGALRDLAASVDDGALRGPGSKGVDIKFDPADIGKVTAMIADPENPSCVLKAEARCTHYAYAKGLTLHQHEVIKRHAKAKAPMGSLVIDQLVEAKGELHAIAERVMAERKASGGHVRVTRFLGVGVRRIGEYREEPDTPEEITDRQRLMDEDVGDGRGGQVRIKTRKATADRPRRGTPTPQAVGTRVLEEAAEITAYDVPEAFDD